MQITEVEEGQCLMRTIAEEENYHRIKGFGGFFKKSSDIFQIIRTIETLVLKIQNLSSTPDFINKNLKGRDFRICIFKKGP